MNMEWVIQWIVIGISFLLILIAFRKPGTKDWLLVYFITATFSILAGVFVVEEGLISYPIRVLPNYFNSAILFESLALPAVNVIYNQTTLHSTWSNKIIQALLYSAVLTSLEIVLERYTDTVEYSGWTWYYSFGSIAAVFVLIRALMDGIRRVAH